MADYEPVPSTWDHMNSGMGLAPGRRISSELMTLSAGLAYKHVTHTLAYQNDGNLVLYRITSYGAPDVGGGAPDFGIILDELIEGTMSGDLQEGRLSDGSVGDDIVEAVWSTGTNGRSAGAAVMQPDGNFVVYDAADQAVWSTGTGPEHAGEYVWLRVQRDGNVVLYKGHAPGEDASQWVSVWATGTNMPD
ncbi:MULTISPECIES: hypothetical protein [unclassified Streptomyces]|uniref:hypothetical protein n=1 Tax=unclassified Streptomyces TaxID=2593676 RepID=UPI002E38068E|nr:hypothetical protein [Streptomyces sp. NBC_01268]